MLEVFGINKGDHVDLLRKFFKKKFIAFDIELPAAARRNIFDFNHINATFSKGSIGILKTRYLYSHKKQYA